MYCCLAFSFLARIALVVKADLDRLARDFLYPLAAFAHLGPLLFVSWRDDHAQQVPSGIDGNVGLAARRAHSGCSRWGASWRIKHRYGVTNAHSSSVLSLG
jgi:hypothetical protein